MSLLLAFQAAPAIAITASQTLDGVSQSTDVEVLVAATASQALAGLAQANDVDVVVAATAAQSLATVAQANEADVLVAASPAQTLATISQTSSLTVEGQQQQGGGGGGGWVLDYRAPLAKRVARARQTLDSVSQHTDVTVDVLGPVLAVLEKLGRSPDRIPLAVRSVEARQSLAGVTQRARAVALDDEEEELAMLMAA